MRAYLGVKCCSCDDSHEWNAQDTDVHGWCMEHASRVHLLQSTIGVQTCREYMWILARSYMSIYT